MLQLTKLHYITHDTTLAALLAGNVRIPNLGDHVTRERVSYNVVDPFQHSAPLYAFPLTTLAKLNSFNELRARG